MMNIGGESALIDNLRYSKLLDIEFFETYLGEKFTKERLFNGRHFCNKFSTTIGKTEIEIDGSQFETDACYVTKNKILIIECKTDANIKSFNIRQLYYPYRYIYDMKNNKKEIVLLFINQKKNNKNKISDEVIDVWECKFEDPKIMTSIKTISYKSYKFDKVDDANNSNSSDDSDDSN